MHVRIANREDPEQTYLNVTCLSMPFCQATSVQNFKTFAVIQSNNIWYCHLQNIFIYAAEPNTCVYFMTWIKQEFTCINICWTPEGCCNQSLKTKGFNIPREALHMLMYQKNMFDLYNSI